MKLSSAEKEWRPVVGFESTHMVSSDGEIMAIERTFVDIRGRRKTLPNRMLKSTKKSNGYHHITLAHENRHKTLHVHRIVLEAFVGECPDGYEALHRNGKKSDNTLSNLSWGTHVENCVDRSRHGSSGSALNYRLAQQVRALKGKKKQIEIAEEFSISQSTVSQIHLGKIWNVAPEEVML